ncbi:hypothetical protein VAWG006_31780 [Aeromonas enteropelogenes]|nr:hypothetical protein VAWG006_31780 [Aeromonas enteropelogenes]BEE23089.1 hypothetical protein VAWG007_31840 [Aeromonas enteropelogenes]
MPGPARAGALIYAKDLGLLTHFYRTLLQMDLLSQDEQLVVLENGDFSCCSTLSRSPMQARSWSPSPPS